MSEVKHIYEWFYDPEEMRNVAASLYAMIDGEIHSDSSNTKLAEASHMLYRVAGLGKDIEPDATDSQQANDPVSHPSHYTTGRIEVLDFIQDKKLNFCRGNAVKYIVRAGLKDPDKEIEDLQKAMEYIRREIEDLQR